jgi:hypothetical protein
VEFNTHWGDVTPSSYSVILNKGHGQNYLYCRGPLYQNAVLHIIRSFSEFSRQHFYVANLVAEKVQHDGGVPNSITWAHVREKDLTVPFSKFMLTLVSMMGLSAFHDHIGYHRTAAANMSVREVRCRVEEAEIFGLTR